MTATTRKPCTVLYIANSGKIGGANRVLTDLVEGLDRRRFTPVIVAPAHGQLTEWADSHLTRTFVVPAATASRPSALWRAARLAWIARRTGAAIVHAIDPVCYREASWAALATGARRVCHIQFPSEPSLLRWVFRVRPHLLITCYRRHVAELHDELPQLDAIVTALPNAVRLDAFRSEVTTGAPSPWKFGCRRMVVIVGHLSDVKGHPTFVRAAALVRNADPDCAFVALGGETIQQGFQGELERLATELGVADAVHFLGWRQNVAEIVRAADVLVLPSLKEGLPLALLEAMACGVPVVATPVNGVPEVIQHGVNGLLVPVHDPDALAGAVLKLFHNPDLARELAAEGRSTVERDYAMSTFVVRMQAMYDDLLAGRRSTAPAVDRTWGGAPARGGD